MMNVLKKSLLLIFALLLMISLIACEGKKQPADLDDDDGDSKKANAEETASFAVIYKVFIFEYSIVKKNCPKPSPLY